MLSNTDKAVNITALIFITDIITFGYMSDTIYAAFISVLGAILASISTVQLMNLKEKREKKERVFNTKKGLKIILEKVFLGVINIELQHYNLCIAHLQNNRYYPDINDRSILSSSLFNSFSEQSVLEMCLYYNLPYDQFYGTINTYHQLNDISLSKIENHFADKLANVETILNLPYLVDANGNYHNHAQVQKIIRDQIAFIKTAITATEIYRRDTENLIKYLQ